MIQNTPLNQRFSVGQIIHFGDDDDLFDWRVVAVSERFAIVVTHRAIDECEQELWYSIIDNERSVRGPHNIVLNSYDFDDPGSVNQLLADLISGEVEVSSRVSRIRPLWILE